jgi:nanoRNase/pAp phosphatase (c-di-AMP/oligoRNAs hydrolase)
MNKDIIVITHKNCPDGFGAAWVAWTIFKNKAIYIAEHPGQKSLSYTDNLKGKNVYIFDISFPSEYIQLLQGITKKLIVIDHHPGSSYLKTSKTYIYNHKRSAAYLCWVFFYPTKQIPTFIKLISDNDTGVWKLKYSKEFSLYMKNRLQLKLNKITFNKATLLIKKENLKKAIDIGRVYLEYQNKIIHSIMKIMEPRKWKTYNIMIGNANIPQFGGLIATKLSLLPSIDIGIVYRVVGKKKYLYTMRSSNKKINLNKIACLYKGGGHIGAASFIGPDNVFD